MKITKLTAAASAAILTVSMLAGCTNTTSGSATANETQAESTDTTAAAQVTAPGTIYNFTEPVQGEEIAVIKVKDFGTIKVKLFPELLPTAVENFKGLIAMNYYDELIFHRVKKNFMIQGGDPRGNGTGGQSMWGGSFDGGMAEGLYHFNGALAYANSGSTATDGSQFYIVCNNDMQSVESQIQGLPDNVAQMYREKGGYPFLDGKYTVFGQVIEGMDVVEAISEVDTDEKDKPLKQVLIESIRIEKYGE